jgi:phosphohistidine swiveling domain-containing protein
MQGELAVDSTKDFSALWKTQKSLTEWLEDIRHADTETIRQEDNDKRERLAELHDIIGLPFDKPVKFTAGELATLSPTFKKYLREHGEDLCALRLIPLKDKLPKLRMRGKTVAGAYEWFNTQDINPVDYRADFLGQERQSRWATVFIVNKHGIHGEIIYGKHFQLTQGFHETDAPKVFHYDFKIWTMQPANDEALVHVQMLAKCLHVPDIRKRTAIMARLGGTFAHNYLEGYFETVDSVDFGTWFLDYSPTLGKMYGDVTIQGKLPSGSAIVSGQTGSPGKTTGRVKIVKPEQLGDENLNFPDGSILVCHVTTPQFVPLMQKAAAIVTDQGGILSHAAIVARELKKPCIVATGNATQLLKDGQQVTVDADQGTVL